MCDCEAQEICQQKFFGSISMNPSMDIPWFSRVFKFNAYDGGILSMFHFISPGDHPKFLDTDETFIAKVKKYIIQINNKITEEDFIDIHASRYRFAQPICEPEFLNKIPKFEVGIKGLLVADTCYYYPEDRGISESINLGRNLAKRIKND